MKKKETNKIIEQETIKERPIASFVIEEYKEDIKNLKNTNGKLSECVDKLNNSIDALNTTNSELNKTNNHLLKTNRIQTILIIILVIFSILLSWYGIMYWDTTHPDKGIITHNSE